MKAEVFKWKHAARIKADPAKAGPIIRKLEEAAAKEDRRLAPDDLVEEVKDKKDHPLYNDFEWDDTVAAQAHRRSQASYIIRNLEIVVEVKDDTGEKKSVTVGAFTTVDTRSPVGPKSGYIDIRKAFSSAELRQRIILHAWHELLAWKKRYDEYKEFAAVFEAMEAVEKKLAELPAPPKSVVS